MTTRDKGITLPAIGQYVNTATSGGVLVTDTANDYTVKQSWQYAASFINPINAAPLIATPPVPFIVKGQNATTLFGAIGGAIYYQSGVGSVGNVDGHHYFQNTNSLGGAWNTAHIVIGVNTHFWIDAKSRYRIKVGAPINDTDGNVVGIDLSASAAYNPPSLADGVGTTTTIACVGAVLGDLAIASFSLDLQGILVTAYVSAADVVSVRFQNETGGVLDLAAGTLTVKVIKA